MQRDIYAVRLVDNLGRLTREGLAGLIARGDWYRCVVCRVTLLVLKMSKHSEEKPRKAKSCSK
jgi:hypothetical protein